MNKYEKETIINFNEAEDEVEIYSCQKHIWNRCEKLGLHPTNIIQRGKQIISKTYYCPKKWIKISKPKKMNFSPEQIEKFKAQLRQAREKNIKSFTD